MHLRSLLVRNLIYHWRANLAVLLGVIIGTAVLTGALFVGDSLRGSLRDLTLKRLGRIDHALVSDRFFPADLAERLRKRSELVNQVVPAIILQGAVVRVGVNDQVRARAGHVQVVGVDDSFWPLFDVPTRDLTVDVLPNAALVRELNPQPGDRLAIHFDRPRAVPAESILGHRQESEDPVLAPKPFSAVLPNDGPGRFLLNARQQQPAILYVRLQYLQRELKENLQLDEPVNALLIAAHLGADGVAAAERLQAELQSVARLEDAGFRLRQDQTGSRYLALESRRMLLEPNVVDSLQRHGKEVHGFQCVPTLTYLANRIGHNERFAPYSTITGLDPSAGPPFGPLLSVDGQPAPPLKDDEVLINDWLAKDLWPDGKWQDDLHKPAITIDYFVESEGPKLREESRTLNLAGVVALKGPAADPTLTPDFPGIRGTRIADWKPPFPEGQWFPKLIRPVDEDYWRRYKATPKAFVSPATALKLWQSRYGKFTSLRLAPTSGADLRGLENQLRKHFFDNDWLPLGTLGMRVQPVKAQGLSAGTTAESFGWLFLGFSLFLIASAAMLVGLLFRLGIERRAKEIGLLYAEGFPHRTARRLLLGEGLLLAIFGGMLGLFTAMGYAALLLRVLNHWWSDSLSISFLTLHITVADPTFGPLPYPSLTIGFALSVAIAAVAVLAALRGLQRVSPRALLAGQWSMAEITARDSGRKRTAWTAGLALGTAIALAGASFAVPPDQSPALFFGSGAALLIGGLAVLALRLRGRGRAVQGDGLPALLRLGAHNAARFPGRSQLTVGLLASVTFLLIAIEAFRQTARPDESEKNSGTGGFALVAEADVPLARVPQTLDDFSRVAAERLPDWRQWRVQLAGLQFTGLRLRPGDDVSCLNLYQPQRPRLLGVPQGMINRGGFVFSGLWQPTESERQNPWLVLNRRQDEPSREVPVIADANTAEWVLHRSLGDTWNVADDDGRDIPVRLVGLLQGSLFQSELLMSEEQFRRLFPSRSGYGFLLIEAPHGVVDLARSALEMVYGAHNGLVATRAADRLAAYQAVENTYLSTFQVLGGLGLLLGTAGLAVVLLRSVWERQGELALFRAVGYSRMALGWLVFAENGFLVLMGLGIGLVAALLAVAPHLFERGAHLPWLGLAALITLELVIGLLAGAFAMAVVLRTPLLPALRRE